MQTSTTPETQAPAADPELARINDLAHDLYRRYGGNAITLSACFSYAREMIAAERRAAEPPKPK